MLKLLVSLILDENIMVVSKVLWKNEKKIINHRGHWETLRVLLTDILKFINWMIVIHDMEKHGVLIFKFTLFMKRMWVRRIATSDFRLIGDF